MHSDIIENVRSSKRLKTNMDHYLPPPLWNWRMKSRSMRPPRRGGTESWWLWFLGISGG